MMRAKSGSDTISRQEAIDAIWSHLRNILKKVNFKDSDYDEPVRDAYKMAHQHLAEVIERLPAAEPERKTGKWIPVIEKLPPECEEVNITWVNRNPESYYAHIKGKPFTGAGIYCRGRWFWYSATCKDYCEEYGFSQVDEMDEDIQVLAWMPLPEPYKEGKRNA